jgi:hypothetical protein
MRSVDATAIDVDCATITSMFISLKTTMAAFCFVCMAWLELVSAQMSHRIFEYRRIRLCTILFSSVFIILLLPTSMYVSVLSAFVI